MAGEDGAYSPIARGTQDPQHIREHAIAIADLTEYADLHVVDHEREPGGPERVRQRLGMSSPLKRSMIETLPAVPLPTAPRLPDDEPSSPGLGQGPQRVRQARE
jgi:hypothetical protein